MMKAFLIKIKQHKNGEETGLPFCIMSLLPFFPESFMSSARFAYIGFLSQGGCSFFMTSKKQMKSNERYALHSLPDYV